MYEVILSEKAAAQLEKLEKPIQERIIKVLERIRVRPEAYIVRLVGDQLYKLRVGDYRILLELDKDRLLILVIKIGHRKNVYQDL